MGCEITSQTRAYENYPKVAMCGKVLVACKENVNRCQHLFACCKSLVKSRIALAKTLVLIHSQCTRLSTSVNSLLHLPDAEDHGIRAYILSRVQITRSLSLHGRTVLVCLLVFTALRSASPQSLGNTVTNQSSSNAFSFSPNRYPNGSNCSSADMDDPFSDCNVQGSQPYSSTTPGAPLSRSFPIPSSFDDGGFDRASKSNGSFSRYDQTPDPRPLPTYSEKEPPTEFQRYVADSIGHVLPIYGSSLFEHVPATFAPLDRMPVSGDYRIAPGDELQLAIWGQMNFSRRLVVDRLGQIIVPEAGPLAVAGMTYTEVASVVKASLSHLYKNFDVSISLARLHTIQIFVLGEARRPGSYTVSSLSTLINAVFASGGPSSRGSMRSIQLRRGSQVLCEFDLYELLLAGDKSKDRLLQPGDVIFFPPAGPRIAIAGSVRRAAIYEVKPKTTVSEALQLSGGLSSMAARSQLIVERVADSGNLQEIHIHLHESGIQGVVVDGDILRMLPIVQRFQNTVTLRGNIADPGRFPWHEGMHLSDLIPNRESLLTRGYWKGRNGLGAGEEQESPPDSQANETEQALTQPQIEPGNLTSADHSGANAPLKEKPVEFQDQTRLTKGDSSFGAATETENVPTFRLFKPRYTIQPSVPEIDWEYGAIERTDRETLVSRTLAFNLGKLVLAHDSAQDLQLLPGDVVTIFSKADFSVPRSQTTVQIRLEGEVRMAGLYTIERGETLRHVLERAGGLTADAYVYGAQFTRESTRREQQKRYNDFLDQLERDINESASSLSSRITSPQQALTAQTSIASQKDLVERLRKVEMNGRIVLDVNPTDQGTKSLPNLSLENGDRLFIPGRPSTINVVGTVHEQSSFLYKEDFRTGDYLKKAGGPARVADRGHMFIIRADGSVVSKRSNPVLFANSFDGLPMYPGDTLVVPAYLNRSTLIRNLLDWSQILSNFGLGAAAINVLR
jgi:polysaccharide biosynthesis/export protein